MPPWVSLHGFAQFFSYLLGLFSDGNACFHGERGINILASAHAIYNLEILAYDKKKQKEIGNIHAGRNKMTILFGLPIKNKRIKDEKTLNLIQVLKAWQSYDRLK